MATNGAATVSQTKLARTLSRAILIVKTMLMSSDMAVASAMVGAPIQITPVTERKSIRHAKNTLIAAISTTPIGSGSAVLM